MAQVLNDLLMIFLGVCLGWAGRVAMERANRNLDIDEVAAQMREDFEQEWERERRTVQTH